MNELFIRDAVPSDVSEIEKIEKASFSTPWSEKWLTDEINNTEDFFWVATDGKDIFGYAVVGNVGTEAELYNIAVSPEHRGKGIGDMLMRYMTDKTVDKGTDSLFLEVRESNSAAIRLYEKHGFKAVGRRRGYYREPTEDAILMMRTL